MENSTSGVPAVIQRAMLEQKVKIENCNLMLPTQTFGEVLGMFDRVTVEVVTINPNPDAGDVFPLDKSGDKLALGKVPLQRISNALAIVWDPATTTVLESTDTKCRAKATGAMRKPNGEYIVVSEEKTVDLGAIEEEQRIKIEEDAEKGKIVGWEKTSNGKSFPKFAPFANEKEKRDHIELSIRKAILPYRKFKDERAMTGAKERVIRAFLGIKSTYTRAELSKPFAFPRVTTDSAKLLATPETRSAAVEHLVSGVASVFGPRAREERQALPIELTAEPTPAADAPIDVPARRFDPETGEEIAEPEPAAEEGQADLFEDDIPEPAPKAKPPAPDPVKAAKDRLRVYLKRPLSTAGITAVNAMLDNAAATVAEIEAIIGRCDRTLAKHAKEAGAT